MSKFRAVIETIGISILIPIVLWVVAFHDLLSPISTNFMTMITLAVLGLVYSKVIFSRHSEYGGLFIFLTVLLSTAIQFILNNLLIFSELYKHGSFSSGEGHPNGDAVMLLIFIFFEPLMINLSPLIIGFIKKVIWLFTDD